jgi:hypothetical protein
MTGGPWPLANNLILLRIIDIVGKKITIIYHHSIKECNHEISAITKSQVLAMAIAFRVFAEIRA